MMNCQKISRLISDSNEIPLSLLQQARLTLHLRLCKRCRDFSYNNAQLNQLMQQFRQQDQ